MPGLNVARSSIAAWLTGTLMAVLLTGVMMVTPVFAQGSSVNAVICGSGAQIAITAPPSDSIVTDPTITLKGTVAQATQIEITVDGDFDNVIPLTTGQTTFEAPLQLSSGTHTVKLTAIDSCQHNNASATTILTFTPPPSVPSTGSQAATGVADTSNEGGGITINSDTSGLNEGSSSGDGLIPRPVSEAFNGLLRWLNIAPFDSSSETAPKLSVLRAFTIALGTYMATIGVATSIVSLISTTPLLKNVAPSKRFVTTSRWLRLLGIALVLGGFFL